MGAQLAVAAMNPYWTQRLTPNARLVLVHMALTARDKAGGAQSGGEYWAGQESLILALRGDIPTPGTNDYLAAQRQAERAISDLVKAGAICRLVKSGNGRRAIYRLTLADYRQPQLDVVNGTDQPVDNLVHTARNRHA